MGGNSMMIFYLSNIKKCNLGGTFKNGKRKI